MREIFYTGHTCQATQREDIGQNGVGAHMRDAHCMYRSHTHYTLVVGAG